MAELFDRDVKTVGKHVANALKEELAGGTAPVVAKFATTASDGKTYQVEHYSLDVVLSVGYRVKSPRGVEFRRWANDVLRRYAVEGHAENACRLEQLGRAVQVMARIPDDLSSRQVLDVVRRYAGAFSTLDAYDRGDLARPEGTPNLHVLGADECRGVVRDLAASQGVEGTLFGNERTPGEASRPPWRPSTRASVV